MDVLVFNAGDIVAFSSGEYSDYGYVGHVVITRRCDMCNLVQEFKDNFIPEYDGDDPSHDGFVSWLVITGRAVPFSPTEVHLGSYGQLQVS